MNEKDTRQFFVCFAVLGLELRAYTFESCHQTFSVKGLFEIGSHELLCRYLNHPWQGSHSTHRLNDSGKIEKEMS
jgi:hypothetical protein